MFLFLFSGLTFMFIYLSLDYIDQEPARKEGRPMMRNSGAIAITAIRATLLTVGTLAINWGAGASG
jgi:hypothetical protein